MIAIQSLSLSSCFRTRDLAKRARSRPFMFVDMKFLLAASSSFSSTSHQVRHTAPEPTSTKGRPSSHCGRHQIFLRRTTPWIALPCTSSEVHSGQIPHCKHAYRLTLEGCPGSRVLNSYPNMSWLRLVTGGQVNVGSGWLGQTAVLSQPCNIQLTRKSKRLMGRCASRTLRSRLSSTGAVLSTLPRQC